MSQEDRKLIRNLCIWGGVFAVFFGSALHFVYGWSGKNFLVGLVAPINESPWEHMKLVFTPIILFGFIDWIYLRDKVENLCFALMKEVAIAIIFILAVFYIYTPLVGHSIFAVDISSFVVSIIIAKWFGYLILTGKFKRFEFKGLNFLSGIILVLIAAFFIYATITPPRLNPFLDSVTNSYGIFQK